MVNRSETLRKAYGYKADEEFRCSVCMSHTAQIEIQVQRSGPRLSASRNRFIVKYSG